jgi:hypothetical protein
MSQTAYRLTALDVRLADAILTERKQKSPDVVRFWRLKRLQHVVRRRLKADLDRLSQAA